jgi:hypothetical protein
VSDAPTIPAPQPVPGPLSPEQLRELELERTRWRKIRLAVGVARFSAWSLAVAVILSGLIGIFDRTAAITAVLLGALTFNEFLGAHKLRRAELSAPMILGANQLLLLGLAGGYFFYKAFIAPPASLITSPELMDVLNDPAARQALADQGLSPDLFKLVDDPKSTNQLFYSVAAIGLLMVQGPLALYYFTRRRVLLAYLTATPAWVVQVNRRAA